MTSRKESATIKHMRFERKIVKKLNKKPYESIMTKAYFVDFMVAVKFFPFGKDAYRTRIENILDDCINEYKNIDYDPTEKTIKVNAKGRRLLTFGGFWEEYQKRHNRFSASFKQIILSTTVFSVISSFITWLVTYMVN